MWTLKGQQPSCNLAAIPMRVKDPYLDDGAERVWVPDDLTKPPVLSCPSLNFSSQE